MNNAIKNLPNGRIGCYGILFGSAKATDLVGEYFADDTDFWLGKFGEKLPHIYDHGTNPGMPIKSAPGEGAVIGHWDKVEVHAGKGLWLEGELDKAHKYNSHVQSLIDSGALKPSSDSIAHLVVREPQQGGAVKLAVWPLVGCSSTTMPCEPRMLPVAAVKSAFNLIGHDLTAEVDEETTAPTEAAAKTAADFAAADFAAEEFDAEGLVNGLTTSELRQVLVTGAKSYPERLAASKAKREGDGRNFLTTQRQDEIESVRTAVKAVDAALESFVTPPAEEEAAAEAAKCFVPPYDFLTQMTRLSAKAN